MKDVIKLYLHTVILSTVFIIFPWFMAYLNFFNELKTLEWYGSLFAAIALFISIICVFRNVKKTAIRFIMILLNPAMLYIVEMMIIRIMFSLETWNGFNL